MLEQSPEVTAISSQPPFSLLPSLPSTAITQSDTWFLIDQTKKLSLEITELNASLLTYHNHHRQRFRSHQLSSTRQESRSPATST
ncbi:unnamed protein product [Parnassius apollo]|uniref:(apollo) hypothetical protein n=1 Tax=Parnassius apollo TaxID=110799 RepID=A0A8S3XTE3_PARAO|nr:unnamed protein product [Parnassius apollo]